MQETVDYDPYGERFTQRWPVTPYTLRVTNRSDQHVQAVVSIDGAKASRQFINGGATSEIKGFKDRSSRCAAQGPPQQGSKWRDALTWRARSSAPFREFLFTVPRPVRAGEAAKLELNEAQRAELAQQLESIRVEFFATTRKGRREAMTMSATVAAGLDAANKAVARGGGAAAVSSAGRTHASKRSGKVANYYSVGAKQAELCIRYTQQHKLQQLLRAAAAPEAGPTAKRVKLEAKPVFVDLLDS